MKIISDLFGWFFPQKPMTVDEVGEEIKHLDYLIRNGYAEDIPGLQKEKAAMEKYLAELRAIRDQEIIQASASAK